MSANERQVGGDHYQKQKIQHWDFVLSNNIPYMEAQIIKYVSRWRDKNGFEDLEKAKHFLEKLIEWETQNEKKIIRKEPKKEFKKVWEGVKPDGWEGFTFEGGKEGMDIFRCQTCREEFKIPMMHNPGEYHNCKDAHATSGYVNQDG